MSHLSTVRAALGGAMAAFAVAVMVPITSAHAAPATVHVYPGDTIYIEHVTDTAREDSMCTAGPIIRLPGDVPAILTAGHCGDDGDLVSWKAPWGGEVPLGNLVRPINRMIGLVMHDYAVIPINVENVRIDIGRRYAPTGYLSLYELEDFGNRGAVSICSVGSKTGSRCGTLYSVNTRTQRVLSNMVAGNGDSGGPVYLTRPNGVTEVLGILRGREDAIDKRAVTVPIELALRAFDATLYIK